jgi:hemerythrin-like domain-containing protein
MNPTDVLRDEHRVILRTLDTLEQAAGRLASGGALADGWWAEIIEWLRAFADRNHHAKEESSLFPAMVKVGVPSEGGPIGVMLEEHRQGRALIAAIEAGAGAARVAAARQYVALLRAHIDKENEILFPLADAVLEPQAVDAIRREFEAVEIEQGAVATIPHAETGLARLVAALQTAR